MSLNNFIKHRFRLNSIENIDIEKLNNNYAVSKIGAYFFVIMTGLSIFLTFKLNFSFLILMFYSIYSTNKCLRMASDIRLRYHLFEINEKIKKLEGK